MTPSDGGKADPDRGRPAATGLDPTAVGSGSVEAWGELPRRARGPPPKTADNCRRLTSQLIQPKSGAADVATSAAPSHPPVSYEPGAICMLLAPLADAYPRANQPKVPLTRASGLIPGKGSSQRRGSLSVAHRPVFPS